MSIKFDVEVKRGNGHVTPYPEELYIEPGMNGRHELPNIEGLIQSIVTHGQLQPVVIRRAQGKPVLVAGFSRWRAISEINKRGLTPQPLRIHCIYSEMSEKQGFLANIEENRVRNSTTAVDDAYNIQRLIHVYQMSEDEAATAYRESVAWIRGRLSLLELAPEAETAVRAGRVKPTAAIAIAKLSKEQQRRVVAKEGKITGADVTAESGKRKHDQEASSTLAATLTLSAALEALFAICDLQAGEMVYEVHSDLIKDIRSAITR